MLSHALRFYKLSVGLPEPRFCHFPTISARTTSLTLLVSMFRGSGVLRALCPETRIRSVPAPQQLFSVAARPPSPPSPPSRNPVRRLGHVFLFGEDRPAAGAEKPVGRLVIALSPARPTAPGPCSFTASSGVLRSIVAQAERTRASTAANAFAATPALQNPAHFHIPMRQKTIQVDSPRQTKSKGFYNTVSFMQQIWALRVRAQVL